MKKQVSFVEDVGTYVDTISEVEYRAARELQISTRVQALADD